MVRSFNSPEDSGSKRSRRDTYKDRCPTCRINQSLCFCESLNQTKAQICSDIRVSIIMHYTERWLTSNTAYFSSLLLDNCEIYERGNIGAQIPEEPFSSNEDMIYLFPTVDSKPLEDFQKSSKKVHLIVPDGSWSKARRIHKREKLFKEVPKYHLTNVGESKYKLRKSPGENFLCTYEAIAYALGALGEKETKDQLLSVFDVFVAHVLASRRGDLSYQHK